MSLLVRDSLPAEVVVHDRRLRRTVPRPHFDRSTDYVNLGESLTAEAESRMVKFLREKPPRVNVGRHVYSAATVRAISQAAIEEQFRFYNGAFQHGFATVSAQCKFGDEHS